MLDPETTRIARDRLTQVFRYLQDLNQLRNPAKRMIRDQPWLLWLRELPDHSTVRLTLPASSDPGDPDEVVEGFSLRVDRPELTNAPTPPDALLDWLERGWDDPDRALRVVDQREEVDSDGHAVVVRLDAEPERIASLESWSTTREKWAATERPARAAYQLFERLYSLRGQLEREAERYDLVVGDGLLLWQRPTGDIHHPLLTLRLQLDFDPEQASFTITEAGLPTELYTAMLRGDAEVDGRALGKVRERLDQEGPNPLGGDETTQFLKGLAVRISTHGDLLGDGEVPIPRPQLRVARDPVIFLRSRTLGYAPAIEAVLDDLRTATELPSSLVRVVGVEPPPPDTTVLAEATGGLLDQAEDALLCKPFNREQVEIVRRLEKHGCVLVQGPPGTGKTHTIANLVGHLLAQDKRILVTSHTPRALKLLRDQIVGPLRPLCVSVLESDSEGQDQLRSSVDGIVERLSRDDADALEKDSARLASHRRVLLEELARVRQELITARHDEYRAVVVGGINYPPADAAREVAVGANKNDWIPSPINSGAALPLAPEEVSALYDTNRVVGADDEREIRTSLPDTSVVPTPHDFRELVADFQRMAEADKDTGAEFWTVHPRSGVLRCAACGKNAARVRQSGSPEAAECEICRAPLPVSLDRNGGGDPDRLELLSVELNRAAALLAEADAWGLALIADGYRGGNYRRAWEQLIDLVHSVADQAERDLEFRLRLRPELGTASASDQARVFAEIVKYLDDGGKFTLLTWFQHPDWKRVVAVAKSAGNKPSSPEDFRSLASAASLEVSRQELIARWTHQVAGRGGPTSDDLRSEPERVCGQFESTMRRHLMWYAETWAPLEDRLGWCGFDWQRFLDDTPPCSGPDGEVIRILTTIVERFDPVLRARINSLRWATVQSTVVELEQSLRKYVDLPDSAKAVSDLHTAVLTLDPAAYEIAHTRLQQLEDLRTTWAKRDELLTRLAHVAPVWAESIRRREGLHGAAVPPGDPEVAWKWRQFQDELTRRCSTKLETLQARVERISTELREVTTQLVDRRAWAARLRRTDLAQRQALMGWLQLVKRIGRGTGKRAPRLQAEARTQMSACRSAVSVWVMPLNRVVESFRPQAGLFDVVIIDEASQSDVMAMLSLYMARQVVVVGDDEQVSPDAVGQRLDEVQQLIDTHLVGIPNKELYDGQMSIYDVAMTSFGGHVCLREHFRCVADIIQFSNYLSYDGKILPLRDETRVELKPHVLTYRVDGAIKRGEVNEKEGLAVAALIASAAQQPEYDGKSFGVISLVGEAQSSRIDMFLRERLGTSLYERLKGGPSKAFCGNPAQFQGDERDVIILSMVDVPAEGPLPLKGSGPRDSFKKRYNVAASRARDQMWLVHSLDAAIDLKPGDLRRRLLEHCHNPQSVRERLEGVDQQVDSEFERLVLTRLHSRGYAVVPQWKVGGYRIDLVVHDGTKRLAIECDGDRYHTLENLQEDLERQSILERLGWTFSRIRGTEFFRDPEAALAPVFEKLERLGITPVGSEVPPITAASGLRDRVVRLAEELIRSWSPDDGASPEEEPASNGEVTPIRDPANQDDQTGRELGADVRERVNIPSPTAQPKRPAQSRNKSEVHRGPMIPGQATLFGDEIPPATPESDALIEAIANHLALSDLDCPTCDQRRVLKVSRLGPYLKCVGSRCGTNETVSHAVLANALDDLGLECPECGSLMKAARGQHGTFIRCSSYPNCKTAIPWAP